MKQIYYVLVVFLMLNFSVFAQDNVSPTTFTPVVVDVRSMGMGNTQILSANGSNALFSNPAILATLSKTQIQVGARGFFGNISNEEWDNADNGITREAGYSLHPKITHISFSMPYNLPDSDLKFAFAGGYYNYFDWSGNSFYNSTSENFKYEETISANGGISMIALGAAMNFAQNFNVAISFNTSIFADLSAEIEVQSEGEKSTSKVSNTYEGSSFFVLSAFATPTPKLSLGFFLRPGYDIKVDKFKSTDNDGNVITNTPNGKYSIPTFYGLGIGYAFTSNFKVNAEYQNRPYADIEYNGRDASANIDNGSSLRAGAEMKVGIMPIRFGIFLDDIFTTKEEKDTAPASLLGFTGGVGFKFAPNFILDLGLVYSSYSVERGSYNSIHDEGESYFHFAVSAKYFMNNLL